MTHSRFQGSKLGEVVEVWEKMIKDKDLTILLGYTGSLSSTYWPIGDNQLAY
jgi:deoxyhypusine synthase